MNNWTFSNLDTIQEPLVKNLMDKEQRSYIRDLMSCFELDEKKDIPASVSNRDEDSNHQYIRDTMVSFKI